MLLNELVCIDTFAGSPSVSLRVEEMLRDAMMKITEATFNRKSKLAESMLGRFIGNVLCSIGKRHSLNDWIPLIKLVGNGFINPEMTHLATQRMLSGLQSVITSSDTEIVSAVMGLERVSVNERVSFVKRLIGSQNELRLDLVLACSPIFGYNKEFDQNIIDWCGDNEESLHVIARFGEIANPKIFQRYSSCSVKTQKNIIRQLGLNFEAIRFVWKESISLNWDVFKDVAVDCIRLCIQKGRGEEIEDLIMETENGILTVMLMKEIVAKLPENAEFAKRILTRASELVMDKFMFV